MALDYQDALRIIVEDCGKTESDLVGMFIESNGDDGRWMGDEWAVRAYESEEFIDYVFAYAGEIDDWFYEQLKLEKYSWI